ncbi:MAG: hypothetical protein SVK08_13460 [Halobacteriota archaeon]|nr:hypothetical protein [Halobacteriota archaeon]
MRKLAKDRVYEMLERTSEVEATKVELSQKTDLVKAVNKIYDAGEDIERDVANAFRMLLKFESAYERVARNIKVVKSNVKEAKGIARDIDGMAQELGIDPKKVDGYQFYLNSMERASYLIKTYDNKSVMSAYNKLRMTLK